MSPKSDPLYSAWLKAERAEKHIADLQSLIQGFRDRNPYSLRADREANSNNIGLTFVPHDEAPDEIKLYLGDAVHNLRSALDHAVYAFVLTPTRQTAFPISESDEGFEQTITRGKIAFATHEILPYIRSIRADRRTYELLLALHDLDIRDKHHLIVAVRGQVNLPAIEIWSGEVAQMWLFGDPLPLEREQKLDLSFVNGSTVRVDQNLERTVEITLGEGRLAGQPVLDAIADLANVVRDVIAGFTRCD